MIPVIYFIIRRVNVYTADERHHFFIRLFGPHGQTVYRDVCTKYTVRSYYVKLDRFQTIFEKREIFVRVDKTHYFKQQHTPTARILL